jgi:hypothetical protein
MIISEYIFTIDKECSFGKKKFFLKQKKSFIPGRIKSIDDKHFLFTPSKDRGKASTGSMLIYNRDKKKVCSGRIVFIIDNNLYYLKESIEKEINKLENYDVKNRIKFLIDISGKNGIAGESLILNFNKKKLEKFIFHFEESGDILILEMINYGFIKKKYLESFTNKVFQFISTRETKNNIRFGVKLKDLKKKVKLKNSRLFKLIIQKLLKEERIEIFSDRVFTNKGDLLTDEEEKLINKLEELYSKESFNPLDIEGLAEFLKIDKTLLRKYIDILIAREKIMPTKGGFFLNEAYLQYIIRELRKMKVHKPRFKIKDFKEITGLSRKHNIPILELLDYLEITRKIGDDREILV